MVADWWELLISVHMRRDLENVRSTETLVAGIARKSLAIRERIGNRSQWAYNSSDR
jgi:hypothetical protein